MTTDTSPRRFTHFGAVFLGGAGLVPHGAHVFEIPAKMAYDAETYMLVTGTLYTGHVFAVHLTVFALVAWLAGFAVLVYSLLMYRPESAARADEVSPTATGGKQGSGSVARGSGGRRATPRSGTKAATARAAQPVK